MTDSRAVQKLYKIYAIKPIDVGLQGNERVSSDNEEERLFYSNLGAHKRQRVSRGTTLIASPQSSHPQPVTYVHIHECGSFSIGIFCLSKSAVIPLHDHPGMTVFSKVLYGSMHVAAYDWDDQHHHTQHFCGMRLAKSKVDCIYNASSGSSVLYPTSAGNIHCFTALTSCAVLDVISPPYADGDPSYYALHLYLDLSRPWEELIDYKECQDFVWLEEIEKPHNFKVEGQTYTGPIINVI
ncbi:hypothetical protein SUGI_1196810 [Cryptomeria japonica]|nr:hypothetical protein SUGI_1196810 [Cryptomeria japonica]